MSLCTRTLALFLLLLGAACTPLVLPAGPPTAPPALAHDALLMPDGARLPLHQWVPDDGRPPRAILLALHGFNDAGRSFMEEMAPLLTAQGLAVYAYDQRGFGAAPNRGIWPGTATLVEDAATAAALLAARHPGIPLYLMGESMGGAIAILAGARDPAPPIAGYILAAPALRGGSEISPTARWVLRLMTRTIPVVGFYASAPGTAATDNQVALRRMSRDPLILHATRVDAVAGLLDLMDQAIAALPACCRTAGIPGPAPVLVLVGARDRIVPNDASRRILQAAHLPPAFRIAFYDRGYHLLLRDNQRDRLAADTLAWIADPLAPLPSGADAAGRSWLAAAAPE